MEDKTTKEYCIKKYNEFKDINKRIPLFREYMEFSGITKRLLPGFYGEDSYSRFQEECGDIPNKLNMERYPLEKIMRQYGDLVLELKKIPSSSVWLHRKLIPKLSGLGSSPHFIKWTEFPQKFKNWIEENNIKGYDEAINIIISNSKNNIRKDKSDFEFEKLINDISIWSPSRGRNTEETYKVELRKHLEQLKYEIQEEFGQSNIDLFVNKEYFIEIKKSPNLGEYDRLFGQLARHLQHKPKLIALIMDVPSEDNIRQFSLLVDKYLNKENDFVKVIKK